MTCTICQCPYELGDEFLICPCLHRFHKDCIKQWFSSNSTCPICKQNVGEDAQPSARNNNPRFARIVEFFSGLRELVAEPGASGHRGNDEFGFQNVEHEEDEDYHHDVEQQEIELTRERERAAFRERI